MKERFDSVSASCSKLTTQAYSTSFSIGILCLEEKLRDPIYAIYGFVRSADEIVDSFHDYDKVSLLREFREDTWKALANRISLNPILNSFQHVVNTFAIDRALIDQFLKSMEMDLARQSYDEEGYKEYILGSAESVGLMCLKVFCCRKPELYEHLKPNAMSLGAAFQKVNFLRDLGADYLGLKRTYFPGLNVDRFDDKTKVGIEKGITQDFSHALEGIKQLPRGSRFGVYVAYVYYLALFKKIKNTPSQLVTKSRISIAKGEKATLLAFSYIKHQLNLI